MSQRPSAHSRDSLCSPAPVPSQRLLHVSCSASVMWPFFICAPSWSHAPSEGVQPRWRSTAQNGKFLKSVSGKFFNYSLPQENNNSAHLQQSPPFSARLPPFSDSLSLLLRAHSLTHPPLPDPLPVLQRYTTHLGQSITPILQQAYKNFPLTKASMLTEIMQNSDNRLEFFYIVYPAINEGLQWGY